MRLIFRPWDVWPKPVTKDRRGPLFRSMWTQTLQLLERELDLLDASEAVLQVNLPERYMRLDGQTTGRRAGPSESGRDPLVHVTVRAAPIRDHRATGWQMNLRAIALGLEALRAVDRYGVSGRGEQYTGWNQLPPARPMGSAKMTVEEAARILVDACPKAPYDDAVRRPYADLIGDHKLVTDCYRYASKFHHPDVKTGDAARFRRIVEARDLLLAVRAR